MSCAELLEHMLEADLNELTATGASPLATHLRACDRCRSVASHLTRETRLLRTAVRRSRRTSIVKRYVVAAAAAALCVAMARSTLERGASPAPAAVKGVVVARSTERNTTVNSAPHATPPISEARAPGRTHGARATASAPPPRSAGYLPNPVRPVRLGAAAAERPMPIAAVRLDEAPREPLGATVRVDPSDGQRATILRTADPTVTVVWLQK